MADLPGHLEGRGSFGGPVRGAYFMLGSFDIASMANNDDFAQKIVAPCDCRISAVSVHAGSITSDPVFTVINGSDDVIADTTLPDGTTALYDDTDLSNREMDKSDVLTIQCIADAGDAVAAPGVQIFVWAWTKGHIGTAKAND